MVYRHASATWDEPSPEERERAMGFQIGTTSHTKVTRLEHNALLGRGMDLNSFTWLLVTCVFFQMYTTPALIQSICNSSNVITWHLDQVHLPIFNTLHVATLLWPSVGVKPNTWKNRGFGVLRDSRMFRARQQGPKHLGLKCSWCHLKGLET
jgi:hypothetical protein